MEEKIKQDLHQYLQAHGKVDERLPECPDIEEKWQSIANTTSNLMQHLKR